VPVSVEIVLDGPIPVQPIHALTTLPGVVVATQDDRWMGGIAFDPYPCSGVMGWDDCVQDSEDAVKEDGVYPDVFTFESFTEYMPITCSSFGASAEQRLRDRATRYLDAADHMALEQQIWQGDWIAGNPNFVNDAVDVGGGAVDIIQALGLLEKVGGQSGLQGVIHMTPRTAAAAASWNLIANDRGTLRTVARGTPVSVGDGYDATQGPSASGANKEWIVMSGQVEIRRSEVFIDTDAAQELERSHNTFVVRAERYVNVAYDPCRLTAALVDLTQTGA
jgi:hypothetical protein